MQSQHKYLWDGIGVGANVRLYVVGDEVDGGDFEILEIRIFVSIIVLL